VLRYNNFEYIIVNSDLEKAQQTLEAIVLAERHKRMQMEQRAKEIIATFRNLDFGDS